MLTLQNNKFFVDRTSELFMVLVKRSRKHSQHHDMHVFLDRVSRAGLKFFCRHIRFFNDK